MWRKINFVAVLVACVLFVHSFNIRAAENLDERGADRVLAFVNDARNALAGSYFRAPQKIAGEIRRYREDWRVAKIANPSGRKEAIRKLTPPKDLFSPAEERDLTHALEGMDKAAVAMLENFRSLEKYLADDKTIDDGKLGLELCDKMDANRADFLAARQSWLAIVEKRAAEAEDVLLADHPLKRQILCAQKIFAQTRLANEISRDGAPDRAVLGDILNAVRALASEGAKPPFPAAANFERLYRNYLKAVDDWTRALNAIIIEGAGKQRRAELAATAKKCGEAYNAFARAVNREDSRS